MSAELKLEAERARFEAEYGPRDSFAWRNQDDSYKVAALQMAWELWQKAVATRAAPAQGALTDARLLQIATEQDYGDEDPKCVLRLMRAVEAATRAQHDRVSDAARDVLAERQRQIIVEGRTPEGDDAYTACELARAAATYAMCSHVEQLQICGKRVWPWHIDWFKRTTYRRDLVKSGALILAEIERLDRDRAAIQAQAGDASKGESHG